MSYLPIVGVLSTVDVGRHALGLERQTGALPRKLGSVLLWMVAAARLFKLPKKKSRSLKVHIIFRVF